jgi:hypothetical protein
MSAAMDRGTLHGALGDDPSYPNIDVEGNNNDIDDEPVSASAGVARYQGSLLPKITKCELPSIDRLTGEETDSSDWVMLVENSLQIVKLMPTSKSKVWPPAPPLILKFEYCPLLL